MVPTRRHRGRGQEKPEETISKKCRSRWKAGFCFEKKMRPRYLETPISTLLSARRKREVRKSPVFSPDLENERGSLDFPPNVRDPPDEIPSSIIRPKPGTRPESRDSPRIHARQQVTSPGGGS